MPQSARGQSERMMMAQRRRELVRERGHDRAIWVLMVQHELKKLHRRGEKVPEELLRWATKE